MQKILMTRMGQFFLWSALLAATALWAAVQDFTPPWKQTQIEFNRVTVGRALAEIERENAKIETIYTKRLEALDERILALGDETRELGHLNEIEALERRVARLTEEEYLRGQQLSFVKSLLSARRSEYEFLRNDNHADPEAVDRVRKEYEAHFDEVYVLSPIAAQAYAALTQAKEDLKREQEGPAELEHKRAEIYADLEAWRAEVEKIKPSDPVRFAANLARDIPLLDFMGSKYELKQVVMENLPDLTGSAKVDRCQTCHLGVSDPRYDDESVPAVFRTHPALDLFVGGKSPHPAEKFGCTSCHLGRGYGTTFTLAAHTPNDEEQEKEWRKKYGWKDMHYWDYPMLPERMNQAMCYSCHKSTGGYELTMAREIFEGRLIYERRGCHGCHKIEGVSDDMKKVGPSLRHVSAKLDQEWAPRWISGPRKFYESARMPHPFGHNIPTEENQPDYLHHLEQEIGEEEFHEVQEEFEHLREEMVLDERVMIESVVAYLYDRSEELEMEEPPAEAGDPERGREIVKVHNCLGCHQLHDGDLEAPGQGYGPDLSKIGTKTNRKWLYNWLKDPGKYWPDGNMPNPRLDEDQLNDVVAYLLTLKDEAYLAEPLEKATDDQLREMTRRYLRAKYAGEELDRQMAQRKTRLERQLYVGQETIYRNGCFGCHEIPGFEESQRIGAELTAEGFKEPELFDFGMHKYVHLSHFRHDWIEQKVKQPYVYFLGKVINRYEQELRMPWFDFSDKDAARITTFIMGQTGKPPHEEYRYDPLGSEATRQWLRAKGRDPDAVAAILAGRKEIERRNCTGCHKIGVGWQYVEVGEFDLAADKENYWLEGALVAHFDPNLPEGRYTKVSQGKEVTEGDKVVVPAGGWVDADVMFGEDDFFAVAYEVLGKEPVQVDVGAGDEIRVELQRPDRIKVNGIGEGYIARFYDDFSMAPPIILNNGAKTRPEWFFKWLKNITPVRNHIEVRMPQFKWTDEEATTVVHAFSAMAGEPFPYETEEIRPLSEIHRKTAREIFGIPGTDEYSGSLSCFSCHPAGELVPGGDKSSWGPNLYLTRDRLQVDFVKSWLRLPKKWMPGTRMTAYFYDEDLGELIANDPPVTPAVAEIGNDEAIVRLAEMLYYLPLMEDVAQALAAEVERLKNAPPPEEDAADVFDEDEEMDDEEEDFEGEDEEDAEEFFDEDEDEDEDPSL